MGEVLARRAFRRETAELSTGFFGNPDGYWVCTSPCTSTQTIYAPGKGLIGEMVRVKVCFPPGEPFTEKKEPSGRDTNNTIGAIPYPRALR